jgi:hypothetical protein
MIVISLINEILKFFVKKKNTDKLQTHQIELF